MKINKRIYIFILLTILLFSNLYILEGANLKELNIDVILSENGNGRLEMIWDYYDDEGTEHYIPIKSKGINISDLEVSKNGEKYEIIDNWDIYASKEEKKGKAGIIQSGDSYEICWGIGEYGSNKYSISYTVEDMVKGLNDSQMLFFQFINPGMSEAPENFNITISGYDKFTEENIRMWGFGYKGDILLEDGKVVLKSHQALTQNNYATVLLKFNDNLFNVQNNLNKNFDEIKEEAFDNSEYVDYDDENANNNDMESTFLTLAMIFFPILIGLMVIIVSLSSQRGKRINININKKKYKGEYYRDIPYDGDPIDIYLLFNKLGYTDYSDIISYLFLKWIKEGAIKTIDYESGFIFKKEKQGFKIVKEPLENWHKIERKFFSYLIEASGSNRILEEDEFQRWMDRNSTKFKTNFIDELEHNSERFLLENKYLENKKVKKFIGSRYEITLTKQGVELVEKIIRFKNYLYDFSMLNERESINVHIWDDLMLYAAIYSITERVEKEFRKLNPKYVEQEMYYNYRTIRMVNFYSAAITNSYTSTTSASSYNSSSGFGGGASLGGGGGSFGGGSGGGTR